MPEANIEAVLALRPGEYRAYWPVADGPTAKELRERFRTDDVYMVALLDTPPIPTPQHEGSVPLGVCCLGWYPTFHDDDPAWGWLHLEYSSKELIGRDLEEAGAKPGEWQHMTLKMSPFSQVSLQF